MKKILLVSLSLAMSSMMFAQTEQKAMYESKAYDNWYIGVNGGLATKTTHSKWLDNMNATAGARIGRWFTPAFGLAVEGNAYFGDKPQPDTRTIVKYATGDVAATVNLFNWWFGYQGQPRFFEMIAVPAVGIGHVFSNNAAISHGLNDLTGKMALDFAFNVDKKKSLQLYLEPALLYSIYGNASNANATDVQPFALSANRSHFQLSAGIIYKFKNSHGSHNFKYADITRHEYVDNSSELNSLKDRIAALEKENEELKNRPMPCVAPRVVYQEVAALEPVVLFTQNSSRIQTSQYANIERVANFLKNNKDKTVEVTGYASTEGKTELNQRLSEKRAEAVKNALVKKYGIDESRIQTSGNGATSKQSVVRAHNRIVTFKFSE